MINDVNVKKQYLGFVSYAYAIGVLLVVLGHSTPTGQSNLPELINDIRTFIYCFHMPLFFFIAGLLLKYTTEQKGCRPYGAFIKNKAVKFLTPYFVFTVIGFVPKILLADFVNDEVSLSWSYVLKIIFNPRLNVWGHFWFLPTLLLMYAVSYVLLKLSKFKIWYIVVIAIACILAVFPVRTHWFALNDFCMQFVYFCLGIGCSNFIVNNRKKFFKMPFAIITAIGAILVFSLTAMRGLWMFLDIRYLSSFIIAVLMLYTLLTVSCWFEDKGCKALSYLDGKTFTIYILSWPCQAVVELICNRIFHFHWVITALSMFTVGLIIPLLVILVYNKLMKNKYLDLIFGF